MTQPVTTLILDGKKVSEDLLWEIESEVKSFDTEQGRKPGLAVILVGDNPASQVYVRKKKETCERVGMLSLEHRLDADAGSDALAKLIEQLNADDTVDGILLQLPLPDGYDEQGLLRMISPDKDVDGFHPENVGKLLLGLPTFKSCTPFGVMEILKYYQIPTAGQHVVIVGRSNIVGKPLAAMMVQRGVDATVTICHSRTLNLAEVTRQADILVAAIGQPHFITADMVSEGTVVIDVGINRIDDPESPTGKRLVGDVDFQAVQSKCQAITPVPGGIGPMTIAMLLKNTLFSAKQRCE